MDHPGRPERARSRSRPPDQAHADGRVAPNPRQDVPHIVAYVPVDQPPTHPGFVPYQTFPPSQQNMAYGYHGPFQPVPQGYQGWVHHPPIAQYYPANHGWPGVAYEHHQPYYPAPYNSQPASTNQSVRHHVAADYGIQHAAHPRNVAVGQPEVVHQQVEKQRSFQAEITRSVMEADRQEQRILESQKPVSSEDVANHNQRMHAVLQHARSRCMREWGFEAHIQNGREAPINGSYSSISSTTINESAIATAVPPFDGFNFGQTPAVRQAGSFQISEPATRLSTQSSKDRLPISNAAGVIFVGPDGAPLLSESSLASDPPKPERTGTRIVKTRPLPPMKYSEVDALLRGYPGRLGNEYDVTFPESPAGDELDPAKTPVPEPNRKLWGPQGLLARGNSLDAPPRPEPKPNPLQKVTELAGKIVNRGREVSLSRMTGKFSKSPAQYFNKVTDKAKSPVGEARASESEDGASKLNISLLPADQMWMLSRVEFILTLTANNFLLAQKDNERMSVESITQINKEWQKRNRPQPTDFLYDFATQYELTKLNVDRFVFHGHDAHGHMSKMTMMHCWKSLARDLATRTFCLPDPALKKILVDGFRILEMLGGHNEAFMEFRDMQRSVAETAEKSVKERTTSREERQKDNGVTKKVLSPLLVSSRGIIDDDDQYYADGIYKGDFAGPPAARDPHESSSRGRSGRRTSHDRRGQSSVFADRRQPR